MKTVLPWMTIWLLCLTAGAQEFSTGLYKFSAGDATSANGQYSLSGTVDQGDPTGSMSGGNYSVTVIDAALVNYLQYLTLGLVSSGSPVGYRSSLVFTATAPSGATGSVVFYGSGGPFSTNLLAGGMAGSLAITNLPRGTDVITAVYPGDSTYQGATAMLNQVVTNHPPVAALYTVGRTANLKAHVFFVNMATNWSDVDGDTVTLAGINLVTTNGVTLQTNSTEILYTNNAVVNDQLSYTITDGYGGTNTGLINVVDNPFVIGTQAPSSLMVTNGTIATTFYGIPTYVYEVQRSTNLNAGAGWVNISTNTVGANGVIKVADTFSDLGGQLPASAYYRMGWQP